MNKTTEEIKSDALSVMQDFWPNGGREWDAIGALYDAIATGKIPGVQVVTLATAREEMVDYIKAAIGEGYQPEHKAAISDLGVIELLDDHSLNREYGKCWQWYNMGGGIHETFQPQKGKSVSFEEVAKPLIKWMAENVHPHHTAVITSNSAELLESKMCSRTDEFLKD